MGILYAVAVPLGNLKDITLRAIEILKSVDCITCEDTRNTRILLDKYDISAKLLDCHKFNEKERSAKISEILGENGTVALVSDAGTPAICDPGSVVERELIKMGHKIVPIPGASALTAFLSAVPREDEFFAFIGFMPRTKQKREEIFEKFKNINCIFYESPNRLKELLSDISDYFGDQKQIAIGRELTKVFEEIKTDTVEQITEYYENNILKGEIVGMIFAETETEFDEIQVKNDIKTLKKQGFSAKDISKILSSLKNLPKNKIYELAAKD